MIYNNNIKSSFCNGSQNMLFREFANGNVYLGLARQQETWGTCTLINISINSSIESLFENGFVDKINGNGTPMPIRIYKTSSTTVDYDLDFTKYFKIDSLETYNLILLYLNENWCLIQNFPNIELDISDGSKYYIFPAELVYTTHPSSNIISKAVKIQKQNTHLDSLIYDVNLIYNNANSSTYNITKIKGLKKHILLDGTFFVDGISSTLEDEYKNYVNSNMSDSNSFFYLVDSKRNIISEKLYLYTNGDLLYFTDEDQKQYLLFKYKVTIDGVVKVFELKFYVSYLNNKLAMFNEYYSSDAFPPEYPAWYNKMLLKDKSIFDIKQYVPIDYISDITSIPDNTFYYVRQLTTSTEVNEYKNKGFGNEDMDKQLDSIYITSSVPFVKYGSIRPKPDGSNYTIDDNILYLWDNYFIVGDKIKFKNAIDLYYPTDDNVYLTVTAIDYDNKYIVLDNPLGNVPVAMISENNLEQQIISKETYILNKLDFAKCYSLDNALKYNMNSIMINITNIEEYENIYRQLIVCYAPIINNGNTYNDKHEYTCGNVLYIGNINPIYRRYLNSSEQFTLII